MLSSYRRLTARGRSRGVGPVEYRLVGSVPRGRTGSALIEFTLIALVFLGLIFAIFDFGRLFYIQFTLHSAVREASRFTVTGNVLPHPDNPGEFLSRVDSIVATLQRKVPGIEVQPGDVSIIGPDGIGDPGGPGEVVTIRVDYDIELVTPFVRPLFRDGVHRYSVSVVSQNEPFQVRSL